MTINFGGGTRVCATCFMVSVPEKKKKTTPAESKLEWKANVLHGMIKGEIC